MLGLELDVLSSALQPQLRANRELFALWEPGEVNSASDSRIGGCENEGKKNILLGGLCTRGRYGACCDGGIVANQQPQNFHG